jgi:hypothetical protein
MFLAIVDNLFDFIVIYYYNQSNSSLPLTLILFYQKGENKSSCARTGRVGQAQHKTYKIFPGLPKQAGKRKGVLGERNFARLSVLLCRTTGGWWESALADFCPPPWRRAVRILRRDSA